jgi:hypothetical protein
MTLDNQILGYDSENKMDRVMDLAMKTQTKPTHRHCE